jgi:hypothetical protein
LRQLALWLAIACMTVNACGQPDSSHESSSAAIEPATQASPEPVRTPPLVFSESELFIWGRNVRVTPPLTPGSLLDASRLKSDSPAVVTIDADGSVHTHAEGTAIVRSTSGSQLIVRVRALKDLRIIPNPAEVRAGGSLRFLASSGGAILPVNAVEWFTEDPAVAMTLRTGFTQAGDKPGSTFIIARAGNLTARVKLTVRTAQAPAFSLVAPAGPVRRGAVVQIGALPLPASTVVWTSSRPDVLRSLSNGIFQAMAPGTAQACLAVSSLTRCAPIEVQP